MKEIVRAKASGFCFGVKQAINKTEDEIKKEGRDRNIYTFGPLIHNKVVTEDLENRGVKILYDLDLASKGDVVIVRSHGEGKEFWDKAKDKGFEVIDATCPFVKKIHILVEEAHREGKNIVIIGDKTHPEVKGINGWCENKAIIVNSKEEAENVTADNLFIVCQTTIKRELLEAVTEAFNNNNKNFEVENTVCNATKERQDNCMELAKKSDAMIVVGGIESSNTQKLYEIAKKYCENTFFVEKILDLPLQQLAKYNKIGVAAGASTPECVIEEVIAKMSEHITEEMNMMDLMDEIEKSLRLPRTGEIVNGKVLLVRDDDVVVNMGCKKDGIIPKDEVTLEAGQTLADVFKVDDEIQAKVIKTDDGDGVILLSKKKLEANENWNEINEAFENKQVLNVKVVRQVNGGVIAAYKEVTGFIPLSQLSDKYVENAEEFIGQNLDIKVTRIDPRRNRAVFSHKAIAQEERQKKLAEVWGTLNVGDVVEGKVMRFTDYGAFVDLGGIDGLLHISEISWGKVKHPKEILEIGDTVQVKVLSMNEEKGKISLGLKQTTPEPWTVINEKYQVGQVVSGKVVQIKEFGAFVELEPGLDGLVHISEVAHKRVTEIGEELKLGQEVEVKILEIDEERKRISLSIKALLPEPEVTEEAPVEEVTEEAPVEEVAEEAPVTEE